MSVATLANRSYSFERQTTTLDAVGGQTKVWAAVLRSSGRIQPIIGGRFDYIVHARNESRVTHRGYFSGTPDIQAGDRIQIGAGPLTLATSYLHVLAVRNIDLADQFLTIEFEERDQ